MKNRWPILALLALGLAFHVGYAQAQFPAPVIQQTGTRLDACPVHQTATGAANTAVTVTVPAVTAKFFYVCSISIQETANAAITGAAGPAPIFTTTNFQNQLVWWGDNDTHGVGWKINVTDLSYANPIKAAAAGTAVTIVTSAGQATQSVRLNVTGYYANQ